MAARVKPLGTMTPRERVRVTLKRGVPDRVPVNYQANPGIEGRLKRHFGLSDNDGEGLLRHLGVDFRNLDVPYRGPRLHEDLPERGVKVDDWGCHTRWIANESGGYWDICDFPLREADEDAVARWPMPDAADFNYDAIREQCERHRQYALCLLCYGDLINGNSALRSMEQTLVDLITDEPAGLRLADRRFAVQAEIARRALEAAHGRIDVLWLGEDLGTQRTPMISMEIFRKHLRPRYQKLVDIGRKHGAQVMIHTCGSSSWAYDDFAEMGIGAVDTLQPEAVDMSPAYLKRRFGDRLAFHGCISTAGPVAFGTVDDVARDCRQILDVMMPGGGYCFAPTHALQDNSPTENVLAMYETAREFGRY